MARHERTDATELTVRVDGGDPVTLQPGTRAVVGRDDEATVTVDRNPTVSRRHLLVSQRDGYWRVTDLGSKRGFRIVEGEVGEDGALHGATKLAIGADDQPTVVSLQPVAPSAGPEARQGRRWRRAGFVALAVGVTGVLVAASVIVIPRLWSTSPEDPDEPALSAWDRAVLEIAETGEASPQTAIEAFAAVVAPVPGVDPGPWPEDALRPRSGTGAAKLVLAHFDDYTPEQQDAIHQVLYGLAPDVGDVGSNPGEDEARLISSEVGTSQEPPLPPIDHEMTTEARDIAREMGDRLGYQVQRDIYVDLGLYDLTTAVCERLDAPECRRIYALTAPATIIPDVNNPERRIWGEPVSDGQLPTVCLIRLGLEFMSFQGEALLEALAHEVFHCFEQESVSVDDQASVPLWVHEGLAQWAGETYATSGSRISNISAGHIDSYLTADRRVGSDQWPVVQSMSYEAVGYWQQLHASLGGDGVWPYALSLVETATNEGPPAALRMASELGGESFLRQLPAQVARRDEWGGTWTFSRWDEGGLIHGHRRLKEIVVRSAEYSDSLDPGSQALFQIVVDDGAVATVSGHGYGTIAWLEDPVVERGLVGDFEEVVCDSNEDVVVALTANHDGGEFTIEPQPIAGTWDAQLQWGDELAVWPDQLTVEIEEISPCVYSVDAGALGAFEIDVRSGGPFVSEPVSSSGDCYASDGAVFNYFDVESTLSIQPRPAQVAEDGSPVRTADFVFKQVATIRTDIPPPENGPQCPDDQVRRATYQATHQGS